MFYDIFEKQIDLIKFIGPIRSRDLHPKIIDNNLEWDYLANGYVASRRPRGSFGFWSKNLIDKIGGNFDMGNINLKRIGKKDTPHTHDELTDWNQVTRNFMGKLYDTNLYENMRYLSSNYRVSKYCIEAERGFLYKSSALGHSYHGGLNTIKNIVDEILR
jgi:hypothetical protein